MSKKQAPRRTAARAGRKDAKASATKSKASASKPAPKPSVRGDSHHGRAGEIAAILRGQAQVGLPGWLRGEAAWAFYASNGVVRQMIGRFALLMTKPGWRYTNSDVADFQWSPTISMLDDLKFKLAARAAATFAFVFGAGILEHVVDDANRDAEKLNLAHVRAYKGVRVHTSYSLRPVGNVQWKSAEWFETTGSHRRRIHRSRLSIMVVNDTPAGIVHATNNGWPPSWLEGIYRDFSDWTAMECDVAAIVHTLSVMHLQLHDFALAAANPDGQEAAAVKARLDQTLAGLDTSGMLVTDAKDKLGEVSRNISGLAELMERKALRAASASGVTKELLLMEADGNLGDNSAPIEAFYDMVSGWAEQMTVPAITDASMISLAVQRYQASGEAIIVPSRFLVVLDPIQQESGKARAEQRKNNAQSREVDQKWGLPLEVLLQDPALRDDYPGIDAWLEQQETRRQQAAAAAGSTDDPAGEDMVSAAQAARPFNISAATLIKMAKEGKVHGRQIVGRWKFYLSKVQEALMGKTPAEIESAADRRLDDLGLSESNTFGEAWGESDAMREIFAVLERVRDTPLSVLLLGETGTGKEGIARGLHTTGSFVDVNCAALDSDPAAAAEQLREAIAAASGGTLFLDEVGDVPREVQSAMLRELATAEGVRLVSATSLDASDPSVMRPDLYFRLADVEVEIPPLRDREGDIVEIARRIYAAYTSERGYEAADPPFTVAAVATMLAYPWPGNIRELKSAVSRGVELAPRAAPVGVDHLQLRTRGER